MTHGVSEGARPGDEAILEVGPPVHEGTASRASTVASSSSGMRSRARSSGPASPRPPRRATGGPTRSRSTRPSADRVPSVVARRRSGRRRRGRSSPHVALPAQRRWKARVVADALRRIGGIERPVEVEAGARRRRPRGSRVAHPDRADRRRPRPRRHVPAPLARASCRCRTCRSPCRRSPSSGSSSGGGPPGARIDAVAPAGGDAPLVLVNGAAGPGQSAHGAGVGGRGRREFTYRVSGAGFWQVHAGAPRGARRRGLAAAGLRPGGHVLGSTAGAGLLTLPLAAAVAPQGRVDAVEGDPGAVRDARRNAHGLAQVVLHAGDVADVLARLAAGCDRRGGGVVVLDPARSGAGTSRRVRRLRARPGAGRLRRLRPGVAGPGPSGRRGARLRAHRGPRAFDLFPHTHHVECVAAAAARVTAEGSDRRPRSPTGSRQGLVNTATDGSSRSLRQHHPRRTCCTLFNFILAVALRARARRGRPARRALRRRPRAQHGHRHRGGVPRQADARPARRSCTRPRRGWSATATRSRSRSRRSCSTTCSCWPPATRSPRTARCSRRRA